MAMGFTDIWEFSQATPDDLVKAGIPPDKARILSLEFGVN